MLFQKLRTVNTLKLLGYSLSVVCVGWGRVGEQGMVDTSELGGLEGVDVLGFLQLNKGNVPVSFFHSHFLDFPHFSLFLTV